ncbi:MAG TPA: choice-of-anchor tandem repeat GloVer-containing protein [Terriglobales bacterium]
MAGNPPSVFRVTLGGTLTTLYSFGGTDGANPAAGLVQATDGNFYGATYSGGTRGTIFEITPSGALTKLYSFTFADGANPAAGLIQGTDHNFYRTTFGGGTHDFGTVFRLATGL